MLRLPAVLLLFCFSLTALADAPKGYPFLPFDEAMQQAQSSNRPVFVYFGRYGCGYCEKTNKEAFSKEAVRKRFTGNYVLAYVDSESGKRLRLPSGERITERELGTRYDAFVTPVFSFLDSNGVLQHRLVGVQSEATLLAADEAAMAKLATGE
jgi:thioredoxin-related protein